MKPVAGMKGVLWSVSLAYLLTVPPSVLRADEMSGGSKTNAAPKAGSADVRKIVGQIQAMVGANRLEDARTLLPELDTTWTSTWANNQYEKALFVSILECYASVREYGKALKLAYIIWDSSGTYPPIVNYAAVKAWDSIGAYPLITAVTDDNLRGLESELKSDALRVIGKSWYRLGDKNKGERYFKDAMDACPKEKRSTLEQDLSTERNLFTESSSDGGRRWAILIQLAEDEKLIPEIRMESLSMMERGPWNVVSNAIIGAASGTNEPLRKCAERIINRRNSGK